MFTHHAGQCEQRGLHLSHVPIFKQIIGLKDVIGLQAVGQDGFDEIPKIFQLQRATERKAEEAGMSSGTGSPAKNKKTKNKTGNFMTAQTELVLHCYLCGSHLVPVQLREVDFLY